MKCMSCHKSIDLTNNSPWPYENEINGDFWILQHYCNLNCYLKLYPFSKIDNTILLVMDNETLYNSIIIPIHELLFPRYNTIKVVAINLEDTKKNWLFPAFPGDYMSLKVFKVLDEFDKIRDYMESLNTPEFRRQLLAWRMR